MKPKYCECCGVTIITIMKNLKKQKPEDGKRKWKGHILFKDKKYFYGCNTLAYCEYCSKKLDDEEIRSTFEDRGECWGAPCSEEIVTGYKCNNCGEEVEY